MTGSRRDGSQLARFEATTNRVMTGVALAVIPIYVAQALAEDAGAWAARPLAVARVGIQIAMGADVAIRTYLAPRRAAFLATHKLDLVAIVVPPIRAARELVALRSILRRRGVARFAIFGVGVIIGCALVVYATEHDQEGASIQSVGDAFWWATVTTTTVGYGDEVPVTDQGRAMAVVLMALGVALLAVLTAHIAAFFVDEERDADGSDLLERLTQVELTLAAIEVHLQNLAPTSRRAQIQDPHDH